MGASPSTPEEPPPPPRAEYPSWLPNLGPLGHRPAPPPPPPPKPPVPELPDELERMIHAYAMRERDRERRVGDILEFRDRSLHKNAIRMWSLRDFCQLVDHKPFQEWLTDEYLNPKRSKRNAEETEELRKRLIDAVGAAYGFYMHDRYRAYVSPQFREELKTRYQPVVDEREKLGFKQYGVNRDEELLRQLEALRYLCQESEIVGTNKFAHKQYYDPYKTRPGNRFSRLRT